MQVRKVKGLLSMKAKMFNLDGGLDGGSCHSGLSNDKLIMKNSPQRKVSLKGR